MTKPCPLDILMLRDMVNLCAFAVEARRVLKEVEYLCDESPEMGDSLSLRIETRRQWTEMQFPVTELLTEIGLQLGALNTLQMARPAGARAQTMHGPATVEV